MKYEEAKARAFVGMGLAHAQQAAEALHVFAESQRIFEEENNSYWAASLELYRAQVQFMLGRFWESRSLAQTAHDRFLSLNIPTKRAMALVLLTRVALEVGEIDDAVAHVDEISKLIEETPIPLHLFPCYSIAAQVAEYQGDLEGAERYYTKAAQEVEVQRAGIQDTMNCGPRSSRVNTRSTRRWCGSRFDIRILPARLSKPMPGASGRSRAG